MSKYYVIWDRKRNRKALDVIYTSFDKAKYYIDEVLYYYARFTDDLKLKHSNVAKRKILQAVKDKKKSRYFARPVSIKYL